MLSGSPLASTRRSSRVICAAKGSEKQAELGLPDHRRRVEPQVGPEALAGEDHGGVGLLDVGQPREADHERPEGLLAGPQRPLGPLAVGRLAAAGGRWPPGARRSAPPPGAPGRAAPPAAPAPPARPAPAAGRGPRPPAAGACRPPRRGAGSSRPRAAPASSSSPSEPALAHGQASPSRSSTPVQSSPRLTPPDRGHLHAGVEAEERDRPLVHGRLHLGRLLGGGPRDGGGPPGAVDVEGEARPTSRRRACCASAATLPARADSIISPGSRSMKTTSAPSSRSGSKSPTDSPSGSTPVMSRLT